MELPKITITIDGSKAFDEMCEATAEVKELLEMVPDYRREEAEAIALNLVKRITGWAKLQ